jgi:folate-binding protein YgfZ
MQPEGETPGHIGKSEFNALPLREHDWIEMRLATSEPSPGDDRADNPVLVIVAATRELGLRGFDLYVPAVAAEELRRGILAAGGVAGDVPTWDVLRIEAGTPAFGQDMDADTIPLEAGIQDRAISFTKGCYVGQEIIIRVMHRGHGRVARRLVGLRGAATGSASELIVEAGARLASPDGARDVGHVTSAAFSPALERWIALGYVHRDFVDAGTPLAARREGANVALVVSELPLVGGES